MICVTYFDRMDKNSKNYKVYTSNPGSAEQNVYEYRVVDGIEQLVPCGVENIQDYIDSFAEEADINNIIARFLNGDDSVLNQKVGSFGDFRDYPKTYAEMFDRVKQCENMFLSLPVEIREKFDHSYQKFWDEYGSDYFNNVFSEYGASIAPDQEPVEEKVEVKNE